MDAVRTTARISLAVQLIVGLGMIVSGAFATCGGVVRDVVLLEAASQVVQFLWYASMLRRSAVIETRTRYMDWVVSTPLMLVSLALFFTHRSTPSVRLHPQPMIAALVLNWGMLAFGYASEVQHVPPYVGIGGGSLLFAFSFWTLGVFVDWADSLSVSLFVFTFTVWALYAVAATLPYTAKNVTYNGLDLLSKNAFGVFVTVYSHVCPR